MKVLDLPYSKKIGIKQSKVTDYMLQLDYNEYILNHIQTVHASASYSLAETTSGYFLQVNFTEIAAQTIPILRSSCVKYKRGGEGIIYSNAKLVGTNVKELQTLLVAKRKAIFTIQVKLYNEQKELVMTGDFEWFVSMK